MPLLGDRVGIIICSIESPQNLWQDTCGATLEEKADGSGDVRTDLQEAEALLNLKGGKGEKEKGG